MTNLNYRHLNFYTLTIQFSTSNRRLSLLKWLLLFLFIGIQGSAYSQVQVPADSVKADSIRVKALKDPKPADNINKQYDFGDLIRNVLHPKRKPDTLHKGSGITVVP